MAGGALRLEFGEIRATIPDLADNSRSFALDPCGRAGQRVDQAPQVGLPGPDIEIVLTVAPLRRRTLRLRQRTRRREQCGQEREGDEYGNDLELACHVNHLPSRQSKRRTVKGAGISIVRVDPSCAGPAQGRSSVGTLIDHCP